MGQVVATRSELLAHQAMVDLARRGRDLLEDKRDQLMEEFRKTAEVILSDTGTLDATGAAARRALDAAEAWDGPEAVAGAALASRSGVSVDVHPATVMGVRMARIVYHPPGRSVADRGFSLSGSSALIDDAAAAFEAEVELLLELATKELWLRRLAEEIRRTTRRVNALETVVIPDLERRLRIIRAALDERERQDRFRLKRIKTRRGARIEAGESAS